ncbi:MAG: hypothetical protein ACOCZB_04640 [Spirochaetota bacterium]
MKGRIIIAVIALGALAACQSTKPVWFIATPGYVEARVATSEDALRQEYDARLEELQTELASQREVTEELAGLATVIRDVEASNAELQDLASQVEDEIAALPETTIRTIVDVLTRHLDESE